MEIRIKSLSDLDRGATALLSAIGDHRVVAFDAPMGAGKTTITAAMCRLMGVEEDTGSPSFSIVNEYSDKNGNAVYHFDFYRLKDLSEAVDIGLEDYLCSGELCLIEWPQLVEPLLPEDTLWISIERGEGEERIIRLEP